MKTVRVKTSTRKTKTGKRVAVKAHTRSDKRSAKVSVSAGNKPFSVDPKQDHSKLDVFDLPERDYKQMAELSNLAYSAEVLYSEGTSRDILSEYKENQKIGKRLIGWLTAKGYNAVPKNLGERSPFSGGGYYMNPKSSPANGKTLKEISKMLSRKYWS